MSNTIIPSSELAKSLVHYCVHSMQGDVDSVHWYLHKYVNDLRGHISDCLEKESKGRTKKVLHNGSYGRFGVTENFLTFVQLRHGFHVDENKRDILGSCISEFGRHMERCYPKMFHCFVMYVAFRINDISTDICQYHHLRAKAEKLTELLKKIKGEDAKNEICETLWTSNEVDIKEIMQQYPDMAIIPAVKRWVKEHICFINDTIISLNTDKICPNIERCRGLIDKETFESVSAAEISTLNCGHHEKMITMADLCDKSIYTEYFDDETWDNVNFLNIVSVSIFRKLYESQTRYGHSTYLSNDVMEKAYELAGLELARTAYSTLSLADVPIFSKWRIRDDDGKETVLI